MTIRFRCQCGKIVKVEEKYAGRRATCPHCGAQLVVPNVSAAPEAGGPNAKADPSAQLPETPALELQLESEGPGPGGKADDALYRALRGRHPSVHPIGDCYQARDIEVAVVDGHRVARGL